MVIISVVGPGMTTVIVVLGFHFGIIDSRIYRGAALSVKQEMFVEAARSMGCSVPRVLLRHILPNILPTAVILFTIDVPDIILIEAGLSFLGFGIPPPEPSWGEVCSAEAGETTCSWPHGWPSGPESPSASPCTA
jgi:peptide/nickel transport system permease protein